MAEVEFALLAHAAQVSSDQLISMLGGGWDTAAVPEEAFPVGIVLSVVYRMRFDTEELGKTLNGEVAVEGGNGERLASVTFSMTAQATEEELPPGWKHSVSMALPVPVQFPGPGLYVASIAVEGVTLKTIPLRIKAAGA
jgi:hypothetical protein